MSLLLFSQRYLSLGGELGRSLSFGGGQQWRREVDDISFLCEEVGK
jgi:hypothetical protein